GGVRVRIVPVEAITIAAARCGGRQAGEIPGAFCLERKLRAGALQHNADGAAPRRPDPEMDLASGLCFRADRQSSVQLVLGHGYPSVTSALRSTTSERPCRSYGLSTVIGGSSPVSAVSRRRSQGCSGFVAGRVKGIRSWWALSKSRSVSPLTA